MILLFISLILLPTVITIVLSIKKEEILFYVLANAFCALFISTVVMFLFAPLFFGFSGLKENYSHGFREGYITKYSEKGIFFITNEGELQTGTGNMSSLQEPFEFSVYDEEVNKKIHENIGKKVRLEYSRWIFQPFNRGESGYDIINVELLK